MPGQSLDAGIVRSI